MQATGIPTVFFNVADKRISQYFFELSIYSFVYVLLGKQKFEGVKMKKLAAAVLVVLVAGCSGMNMGTSGGMGYGSMSSGTSNMGTDPSRGPIADPNTRDVIDSRTGNLTIYHGG